MADWENTLTLVGFVALAYTAAIWLALLIWTYRDIQRRTNNETQQTASVLLVALLFVPGWLVYLLMRPSQTVEETRMENLQASLFSRELTTGTSCSRCHRTIEDDYMVCPYCREPLRVPCASCSRPAATHWAACAYCGEPQQRAAIDLPRPATTPRPATRPVQRPLVARQAR